MRELTLEELELIAGGDVTVTGNPGGDDGFTDYFGDNGDSSGGDSGSGGDSSPPDTHDCPAAPTSDYASNNPTVMHALKTANTDISAVQRADAAWSTITAAANAHNIDPALLAAVGVRESGFKDINQIGGGLGRGVFQIDLGAHPNVTEAQANDLTWSANYAANLLASDMATLAAQHPNFTADQLEQATAASYNFGTGNISGNPATIDQGTTGNNYGSNVVDLTHAFKVPGTDMTPGATPGSSYGC